MRQSSRPSNARRVAWRSPPAGAGAPGTCRSREHLHLGLDDLEARLDELLGEVGVLTGRLRDVPPVDEHVDEPVAAVDRAGHRPVRDRDGGIHRARGPERRGRARCGRVVDGDRVTAEQVAVERVADLLDGLAPHQLGDPEVPADDVVHQSYGRPNRRRPSRSPTGRPRRQRRTGACGRGPGRAPREDRRPSGLLRFHLETTRLRVVPRELAVRPVIFERFAPRSGEESSGRRREAPPAQPLHEHPRPPVDRARAVPGERHLVAG